MRKQGISLIVLIITIIVVIILAAAVILTLSNNNPLSSAKEATFKSDIRSFQEEFSMYNANQIITDYSGSKEKLTMTESPKLDNMKQYIKSYSKKYAVKEDEEYVCKLGIENDEIIYYPNKVTESEIKWLDELGIKSSSYTVPEANEKCFIWDANEDTVIIGYDEEELKKYLEETNGQLKIPSKCTSLGNVQKLFSFKSDLKDYIESIIFQDGTISIYYAYFSGCINLKDIFISKTLTSINFRDSFYSPNLVSFDVSDENPTFSSQDGIVYNKNKKELIRVPRGIKNCTFPNSVITIREKAFIQCDNLYEVNLPVGLINIGVDAFFDCTELSTITFPSTLEVIGNHAFSGCTNLSGTVVIPDLVSTLEKGIFDNTKISKIVLGINMQNINFSENAGFFDKCYDLTDIEVSSLNSWFSSQDGILYNKDKTKLCLVPIGIVKNNFKILDTVTEINTRAFNACKGISGSILINSNVVKIGKNAFFSCENITNINCEATSKPAGWDDYWNWCCDANVNWGYGGE